MMRQRIALVSAATLSLAAASTLRAAGYADEDVLVIDERERHRFMAWALGYEQPPLRERVERRQFQGALGYFLNSEPALASYTSERPLTKRQRRRARGKGNP